MVKIPEYVFMENEVKILWLEVLKHEHFLNSFLCDSKFNIFGL